MVEPVIVRASSEQKSNFQDIRFGGKTLQQVFLKKLGDIDKEFTETFKPFCYICAKLDFEDKVQSLGLEMTRTNDEDVAERLTGDLDVDDFIKTSRKIYGNLDSFKLLSKKTVKEMVVVQGIKERRFSAMEFNYRCIKRDHGRTIQMPWYVYRKTHKDAKELEGEPEYHIEK